VERRTGTAAFETRATLPIGATSFSDTTLVTGTAYQYRVLARNDGGSSAPSNSVEVNIPAGGVIKVAPAKLAFGTVRVGTTKTKTLRITNSGRGTLAAAVGTLAAPFRIVSGGGAFTLAPRASRTVTVEYAPTAATSLQPTLLITSTDSRRPEIRVPISGKGKP
ncbi:MAG: Abnormal spindle-like microcephaly-assocd, ASPM-SPD-2-Hydin, partial [Armatimonadetes bacterium]|nr:Abnormal spindle-like microcephaly-assocd, ASPM-SPD-2-Hydin [Armatimonadota bacterium]